MKKLLILVAVVLVGVILFATLSYRGPAKTADEACALLKENGYTVTVDGEKVVSAVKGDDYITITYCDDLETANKLYDEAAAALKRAEEALEKAEKALDEKQDEIDDMQDGPLKEIAKEALVQLEKAVEEAQKAADIEIGRSGTMVWVGTEQAVDDAS